MKQTETMNNIDADGVIDNFAKEQLKVTKEDEIIENY